MTPPPSPCRVCGRVYHGAKALGGICSTTCANNFLEAKDAAAAALEGKKRALSHKVTP